MLLEHWRRLVDGSVDVKRRSVADSSLAPEHGDRASQLHEGQHVPEDLHNQLRLHVVRNLCAFSWQRASVPGPVRRFPASDTEHRPSTVNAARSALEFQTCILDVDHP